MAYSSSGWEYSDWQSQSTYAAQRTRLILHLQEIADYICLRSSGGGQSVDPQVLQVQYKFLMDTLDKRYGGAGFDSTHPAVTAGFVRAVPRV